MYDSFLWYGYKKISIFTEIKDELQVKSLTCLAQLIAHNLTLIGIIVAFKNGETKLDFSIYR